MIAFLAMHSAICINPSVIPFSVSAHGLARRASAASEKKILGVSRDFGQVQGKIGAPCRDMTQISWQL